MNAERGGVVQAPHRASLSVVVSGTLGTVLGLIAGYARGLADVAIMRLVDIMMSIPAILLAIITVAVVGPGINTLVLVLGLTRWPRTTIPTGR